MPCWRCATSGEEGVKVRLRVVDTASGALTRDDIEDSDVIIGPVTYAEVRDALPLCGGDKVLVSPLDPKTAELAAGSPVIRPRLHGRARSTNSPNGCRRS